MIGWALNVLYASVLIVISWYDIRERRIPNKLIYPALLLALVMMFYTPGWQQGLLGGAFSAMIFIVPILLYGVERAGVGDVKLALFIGLILGFPSVLYALFLAFLSAACLALVGLAARRLSRNSLIPFAPFLSFGAIVCLFLR